MKITKNQLSNIVQKVIEESLLQEAVSVKEKTLTDEQKKEISKAYVNFAVKYLKTADIPSDVDVKDSDEVRQYLIDSDIMGEIDLEFQLRTSRKYRLGTDEEALDKVYEAVYPNPDSFDGMFWKIAVKFAG